MRECGERGGAVKKERDRGVIGEIKERAERAERAEGRGEMVRDRVEKGERDGNIEERAEKEEIEQRGDKEGREIERGAGERRERVERGM